MSNYPIKMIMQETDASKPVEVLVYDFLHNTDSYDSLALCWVPTNQCWMTVPIYFIKPIIEKPKLVE